MLDLGLMFLGMIITAAVISRIQRGPVEGSLGIMDLIVGSPDPRDRVMGVSFSFIVPVVVGAGLSWFATNKIGVAAAGTGMGALISVSVAFIRPDILAPAIRKQLRAAQITYASFVISYAALGAAAAVITSAVAKYYQQGDIVNNLAAGMLYSTGFFVVSKVLSWLSSLGLKSAPPQDPSDPRETRGNLMLGHTSKGQAAQEVAVAEAPIEQAPRYPAPLGEPEIRQIVRDEIRNAGGTEPWLGVENNQGEAPSDSRIGGPWWWGPKDQPQRGYLFFFWKPSRSGEKGYYFRQRYNRRGFFA